jgi:hypothetical protein
MNTLHVCVLLAASNWLHYFILHKNANLDEHQHYTLFLTLLLCCFAIWLRAKKPIAMKSIKMQLVSAHSSIQCCRCETTNLISNCNQTFSMWNFDHQVVDSWEARESAGQERVSYCYVIRLFPPKKIITLFAAAERAAMLLRGSERAERSMRWMGVRRVSRDWCTGCGLTRLTTH